jgi:hypothetical protein
LDQFVSKPGRADGRGGVCKPCDNARKRGEPVTPRESPLQASERHHREAVAKRDLRSEHQAQREEINTLRATLEALGPLQKVGPVRAFSPTLDKKSDAIACIVLSDCHIEETVVFDRVNGLNEYNPTIAEWRMANAFKNGLTLAMGAARDSKINTLYMPWLGDFFSGYLHL